MLLCRRLLRLHIPKRIPPSYRNARSLLSVKIDTTYRINDDHVNNIISTPSISETHDTKRILELHTDIPTEYLLDRLLRGYTRISMQSQEAFGSPEERLAAWQSKFSRLDAYEAVRKRDRSLLSRLPLDAFIRIAKEACSARSMAVMDDLASDALEVFTGSARERSTLARSLLTMSATHSLLRHDRAISLLPLVEITDSLPSTPTKVIAWITRSTAATLSPSNSSQTVDTLLPILIQFLGRATVPAGAESMTHDPPIIVRAAFALVRRLLTLRQEQFALDIFQVLVHTNNIPPEALNGANSGSRDFNLIIRSTLVRSCLHWRWGGDAAALLTDMIHAKEPPDELTVDLAVDAMYTLLEDPSSQDIGHCCSLICLLDSRADNFIVPHGLIRLFYSSARRLNKGDQAEHLYAYTQSERVLEQNKKRYPPPQGGALPWLMRYLTRISRNMHLGRVLASQVVESNEPIPLQDRAQFIAITAANGYGTHARTLWERYSVGRDRNMVVGNASTMLRIVSLFGNLISREKAKLRNLPLPVPEDDGGTGEDQPDEDDEAVKCRGREFHEERLNDFTTFAQRVLTEFRRTKEPLTQATHLELNSLARAYFILGQVSSGFEAFKVFMDRKEVPDLYDVNVALSAMAEYHPQNAARMIERMAERGLEPDAVTFGTVLHHAIIHRDMALVNSLTQRARELDHGQLTLKSVSALIRASVTVETESRTELRENLDRALHIIESLTNSSFVCTPNTGKYCIFAALRVDDPLMAFKFWRLLVKDKAEWDDREQNFQRRLIARRIGEHCRAGWLRHDRGAVMLSQMGEEGVGVALDRRRR